VKPERWTKTGVLGTIDEQVFDVKES